MSLQVIARCCVLSFVLTSGFASLCAAPPKAAGSGHAAVDVVSLKMNRSLRGEIIRREPNGSLSMIVSHEWLRSTNPMMASEVFTENLDQRKAAWIEIRDRITERLKSSMDGTQVTFFLKQEQERINKLISDRSPDPDFLWIDVPHETIVKVVPATPEQHRVASFAWDERLAHVETRDATALTKELTAKGVKLDESLPDLSDRLPARPQANEEWEARMALINYTLDKPIDFQGMGETLVRTGEGKTINLGEILPKIFQQQVNTLLKDLTTDVRPKAKGPDDAEWLKPAIRAAEKEKAHGFRVTRLEFDSTTMRVTVETRFVARLAPDKWRAIWQASRVEDGTKPRPQVETRIEQDPQLKSAIDSLKTLGLTDARTLQQAIRVGAATMAAQQSADGTFSEFRDRYARRLDGPPLPSTADQ